MGHTVVCNLGYCIFGFLECGGRFVGSTFVWHCDIVSLSLMIVMITTYYFHAKSRDRQIIGSARPCNQKTALGNNLGTTPSYSVENPSLGATVA
jgi:hypothetical protein